VTINLDWPDVTIGALKSLTEADRKLIGTPDYMGIAWFWKFSNPQKQVFSTASMKNRRRIHNEYLEQGLDIHGDSGIHRMIVHRILNQ